MSMTLKCTTHELLSLTVATAALQNSAQQRDAASTASSWMPTQCISHLLDNDTVQTNKSSCRPERRAAGGQSSKYDDICARSALLNKFDCILVGEEKGVCH